MCNPSQCGCRGCGIHVRQEMRPNIQSVDAGPIRNNTSFRLRPLRFCFSISVAPSRLRISRILEPPSQRGGGVPARKNKGKSRIGRHRVREKQERKIRDGPARAIAYILTFGCYPGEFGRPVFICFFLLWCFVAFHSPFLSFFFVVDVCVGRCASSWGG